MRVLLVQAPSVEGPHAEIVAPLGLAAVAAAARGAGHEVELVDLNLETDPFPALAAALERVDPQVVGIGLRNIDPLANRRHSYLPAFGALLEVVRRELPGVPLVVGGAGFSMFPRAIMERYPAVDVGVFLEGEETFPEVLVGLEQGAGPSRAAGGRRADASRLAGIPGTIVRVREASSAGSARAGNPPGDEGTRLIDGPPRPWLAETALDAVRTWLPELAAAYAGRTSYAPAAGVETKRGCPLGCSYCVYPALQGKRLRFRSPDTILAEVEALHWDTGAEWVHFTDPVLNYPAGHFRGVCGRLVERGLPVRWTGFFREDALTPADAELAVRAGCAAFQFSGDGTCDRTLARLRKGLVLDDLLAAARAAAGTEALSVYHFMANVPGTDAEVAAGAHELVDRLHHIHGRRENLGAIVFNNLRVYPGTRLAAELAAAGHLDPEDHLLFPTYYDPAPYQHLRYELEERHHLHASRRTGARGINEEASC
ncbi:MAG: B12-binding domain-containing radical SAM protein [Thermoleophilia bacterium]